MLSKDTLKTRRTFTVNQIEYDYYSLKAAEEQGMGQLSQLPRSLKILLENLLRHEDGQSVTRDDIQAINQWVIDKSSSRSLLRSISNFEFV